MSMILFVTLLCVDIIDTIGLEGMVEKMIVGIDMGGTHIDGAIIDKGKIIKTIKRATDKDDLFKTIWITLKKLLEDVDKSNISRINLSTTISTNAIVENKVSSVGMLINSGPGRNYDFTNSSDKLAFVDGYIDHRGKIVKELSDNDINKIKESYIKDNIESIGIVSKFSTRNPSFEKRIRDIFIKDFDYITMGHSLSGKLNFPRRVHTTYLNAAVSKTFKNFAHNIEKSLTAEGLDIPVYVLKADGGTMDLATAISKPVETILSGPAASFMGLSAIYTETDDGILLDVGGTTTDIFFLSKGVPLFEPLGINIKNHKTLIRAIYSVSIGLGGDSFVRIEGGKLQIGPERKGKPVAFGGEFLTVTDAMVALNMLEAKNRDNSISALETMSKQLKTSVIGLSNEILNTATNIIVKKIGELLEKINAHPVYTIRELLEDQKIIPKFVNIIGGPAEVFAPLLEDKLNIKVKFPKRFSVANAIGAALAKPTMEINMHADTDRRILSVPEVEIYENINTNYNLSMAEERALDIVIESAIKLGASVNEIEAEIVESSSFNMVKGYMGRSKNIRVKAQVKPGLIYDLKGEE